MIRRRGFTLVEVLLALSLLGVFSLVAYRLLGANMKVTEATLMADSNSARFDRAVAALRTDVFDSASLEMPSPGLLRVHGSDKQIVEWKIDHNTICRTQASARRTWDVGQPLDLKLDGAVVLLSVNGDDQLAMAARPKGGTR